VAALLRDEGLAQYYDLARGDVAPVGPVPASRTHAWLEPVRQEAEGRAGADRVCELRLDVQGIHCAACVWLMNETFRRAGGLAIVVNPALGTARLAYARGRFDADAWVTSVERFGYQFGPQRKRATRGPGSLGSLTWRLGICAALAMNVMLFSLSFYFGLRDGDTYRLFTRLSVALSTAVVAIGGWPFFVAAARGLRARVLHLDLPIALGMALVYATSIAQVAEGRPGTLTYFDTLNVFVTLMLLGRYLQQALIERNRNFLLTDDGAEGIFVRRVNDDAVEVVAAPRIRRGDRLLVAPGEPVPVDARLDAARAAISTDWINGEATPRALPAGAIVPAGSFNAGRAAFTVIAASDFADSPLVALLRQAPASTRGKAHLRFWDGIARRWVGGVLTLAAIGLAIWLPHGAARALDVTVALLVVTCPCGIGIALPLAYELVQARLRRAGFFARSGDLMDRLVRVRTLVFDKTGTLTLGGLELADPSAVGRLPPAVRDAAYNLACRSNHPVSACIAAALARAGARFDGRANAIEVSGFGLFAKIADSEWRLGRAEWAAPGWRGDPRTPVLARDGIAVAALPVREAVRSGVAGELGALREQGFDIWMLSGDAPARAARLGELVGIRAEHVLAGRSPEEKATEVGVLAARSASGNDVLYLGDGANDAPAFATALCAGTVAIDRPVLPGRSDFFLVGATLSPLRTALDAARRLRRVARELLVASLAYNVFAVATSLSGHMTPLRAAIFMPLSSLSLLAYTATRLAARASAAGGQPAAPPVAHVQEAAS
jgi:Cu2+-exporting ATPase